MSQPPAYSLVAPRPDRVQLRFSGAWTLHNTPPSLDNLLTALTPAVTEIVFACDTLEAWDTRLLIFLKAVLATTRARGIEVALDGLPQGVQRMLTLSTAVPEQSVRTPDQDEWLLPRVGRRMLLLLDQCREVATFIGEILLAMSALLAGRRPFKPRDFFAFMQNCGVESLPIVSLIAVLVGVILSFVGAVQLQMFGAQIYVANLVGLGMVLEMGALMSGVIIAGRIGAAYAAQLGTMQVNEEIDALRTMGISPVGFLVLPRMLALMLMLPLLCIYADIMGILGGSIIGVSMLDLSLVEYLEQTRKTLTLNQCGQGLLKSSVFGVLIGFAGCLRGMQCGRSALAVGEATTSAVVTSIVLIVVSDSFITYLLYR
jgi:phospholipid/cholesterol/gamma-HCH transport system permease protein